MAGGIELSKLKGFFFDDYVNMSLRNELITTNFKKISFFKILITTPKFFDRNILGFFEHFKNNLPILRRRGHRRIHYTVA